MDSSSCSGYTSGDDSEIHKCLKFDEFLAKAFNGGEVRTTQRGAT